MFVVRWAAWALVLVLIFGGLAEKQQSEPLVTHCGGIVSGGSTLTVKGIRVARAAGEWLYRTATSQPPTERQVQTFIEDTVKRVLWYWFRSFMGGANGQKIDPEILRLEEKQKAAEAASDAACTPCPPAPTPPPDQTAPDPASFQGGTTVRAAIIREALRYPWNPRTAVAVAGAESSWQTDPGGGVVAGSHMRGAFQINERPHADLFPPNTRRNWRSIADNTWMAFQVYRQAGNSWVPWSTYGGSSYRAKLDPSIPARGSSGGSAQTSIPPTEGGQPATAGCASPTPSAPTGGTGSTTVPALFNRQGNPRTAEQAIAWMQQNMPHGASGEPVWRACERYMNLAYGLGGGYATAREHWEAAGQQNRTDPPRGAIVFWHTSSEAWHAALAAGNGMVYSTDYQGPTASSPGHYKAGVLGFGPLTDIDKWGPRQGWRVPNFGTRA